MQVGLTVCMQCFTSNSRFAAMYYMVVTQPLWQQTIHLRTRDVILQCNICLSGMRTLRLL